MHVFIYFIYFSFFCFWPCHQPVEVLKPAINPTPQQQPEPLQWLCRVVNLLHHRRISRAEFLALDASFFVLYLLYHFFFLHHLLLPMFFTSEITDEDKELGKSTYKNSHYHLEKETREGYLKLVSSLAMEAVFMFQCYC